MLDMIDIMVACKFIFVVFIFHLSAVYTLDTCATKTTCQECIRDPSLCVWCAKNEFNETRCRPESSYEPDWCPSHLQKPSTKDTTFPIIDIDFTYNSDHVIQIRPQLYQMKLRPGREEEFKFSFKGAPNYPVDLYFLMDASLSMLSVKAMAAKQSENIYNTIKNMTNNVTLGFGTFVDKRSFPYTKTFDPETTYSFRHHLKLNNDFTKFQKMLSNTSIGKNYDPQEGGLDALAQVMICKDIIGWRKESRKIVIFLTDGPYHAAGDGKSAGIFQPYDGQCYTENNTYSKELEMDYPSVGMINKLAMERNIIVLFYVKDKVDYIYRSLSNAIRDSRVWKYSDVPDQDDDAIVRALKEIYEQISSKIIFKTIVKSGLRRYLEFSFKPNCTSQTSESECDVEIGKEKQFVGTVKLLEYTGHNNVKADVVIESIGEKLTLNIEVINSCECERDDKVEMNSDFCHGERRVCGQCVCSEKRYGDKCACLKNKSNSFNNTNSCKTGSDFDCSGHGSCVCGKCVCREGYSGEFCNCNQLSCPRNEQQQVCSNNGECICGKCKCHSKWTGPACNCLSYDCMENGKVCNNRGSCVCGSCKCNDKAPWDKREKPTGNCKMAPCPECHQLQCDKLESSALCHRDALDDCPFDGQIQVLVIQNLTEEYTNNAIWNVCPNIKVDIGCYTSFVYRYDDENYSLELVVQKDKNCAETYYMFGGAVLLVLVVVGVCTLVAWKLLTDARDRREFNNFVTMSAPHQGVVENPLYAVPTSKFDNPGFRKRSFK